MRELGDDLTPDQAKEMIANSAHLLYAQPKMIVEPDGTERPLDGHERKVIAGAFLEGSVARLAQWWREGHRDLVPEVMNALDENGVRVVASMAVAALGDAGWTIAETPTAPDGTDPNAN
jgi:hypothetical protein